MVLQNHFTVARLPAARLSLVLRNDERGHILCVGDGAQDLTCGWTAFHKLDAQQLTCLRRKCG